MSKTKIPLKIPQRRQQELNLIMASFLIPCRYQAWIGLQQNKTKQVFQITYVDAKDNCFSVSHQETDGELQIIQVGVQFLEMVLDVSSLGVHCNIMQVVLCCSCGMKNVQLNSRRYRFTFLASSINTIILNLQKMKVEIVILCSQKQTIILYYLLLFSINLYHYITNAEIWVAPLLGVYSVMKSEWREAPNSVQLSTNQNKNTNLPGYYILNDQQIYNKITKIFVSRFYL